MSHDEHHQHLYIHFDDEALRLFRGHRLIEEKLDIILLQLLHQEKRIMATLAEQVQELKDGQAEILVAVQAEKAEIVVMLEAQNVKIAELEALVASGGTLTPEQMAELKAGNADIIAKVNNISEPVAPA